jgi:hypothetical protein
MLGRLGQGACRHQPIRRPAAQSRTRDSLARDQIRAGGEFLQNHFLEWNLSSGRFALLHGQDANKVCLPTREALSTYLSKLDLEWDFAQYLWLPVSRAQIAGKEVEKP